MSVFRRETEFSISQGSRERYKEWIASATPEGEPQNDEAANRVNATDFDPIKNTSDIIAERIITESDRRKYGFRGFRPRRQIIGADTQPAPSVDLAERISPEAVYHAYDYFLWPGEAVLSAGGRPGVGREEPTFVPVEDEVEAQIIDVETKQKVAEKRRYSYGKVILGSLIRGGEALASVRTPEINLKRYSRIGKVALSSARETFQDNYERFIDWSKEIKVPKINRRAVINSHYLGALAISAINTSLDKGSGYIKEGTGWLSEKVNFRGEDNKEKRQEALKIGAAVLLLAGVTIGSYFSYKSGTSALSHGHEAAPHSSVKPTDKLSEFSFTLPLHIAKVHAVHHTQAIAKHAGYHMQHLRYYGDTIWYHAKAAVVAKFPHASPEKIGLLTNKYSQLIVRANHIKDTTHMLVGQSFKMPRLR